MKVRRLEVENFRGIRTLCWDVDGDFLCLIGPGDSTKTTILDAIELVLSPRWTIPFNDNDFHGADSTSPIRITATIGDLPLDLLSDAKFGLFVRGWSPAGDLHDEPEEGDLLVLTVQLTVDRKLDPEWRVVNDRLDEERYISARDRDEFRCTRLGTLFDRHFAWGKGSTLTRLTAGDDDVSEMLAEAGRAARNSMGEQPEVRMPNLMQAAVLVQRAGERLGVAPRANLRPLLDVAAVTLGVGGLALHDGDVPFRMSGLGSRRLLAIAMQREAGAGGSVVLLDEVELGLEPHRLRRAIRALRPGAGADGGRQVFTTTHSPTAVQELNATELQVVRNDAGEVRIHSVPAVLGSVVLRTSEAMLARRIIVCEGKSELGFCRRLDEHWSRTEASFGQMGVALAFANGTQATGTADALVQMGYTVALLCDSDVRQDPSPEVLEAHGVTVLRWDNGLAIEERVARDLPWAGVAQVVQAAFRHCGQVPETDALASALGVQAVRLAAEPSDWPGADLLEPRLREAIGRTAKSRSWFKRVDLSEELAAIVIQHLAAIPATDLARKIETLKAWTRSDA